MDIKGIVLKAINEKKGDNVLVYDTTSVTPYMDCMIIASAANSLQANAIAQNIKDRLFEQGYEGSFKVEGDRDSRWILVDLKDVVVHIFTGEERLVYNLEKLYAECPSDKADDWE